MGNFIAARLRELMAGWGYAPSEMATALGWTVAKVNRILEGKTVLDDPDLLRLCVFFRCSPTHLFYGVGDISKVPPAQQSRFVTLSNLWASILEQEASEEAEGQLFARVMEGAGKRRNTAGVSRETVDKTLRQILDECPEGGTCWCGHTQMAAAGRCPYGRYFEP